jgi:hypothetical protein
VRADRRDPGVETPERRLRGVPVTGPVREDAELGLEPHHVEVGAKPACRLDPALLELPAAAQVAEIHERAAVVLVAADHRLGSVQALGDRDALLLVGRSRKIAAVHPGDAARVQDVRPDLIEPELLSDDLRLVTEGEGLRGPSAQHGIDRDPGHHGCGGRRRVGARDQLVRMREGGDGLLGVRLVPVPEADEHLGLGGARVVADLDEAACGAPEPLGHHVGLHAQTDVGCVDDEERPFGVVLGPEGQRRVVVAER